MSKEKLSIKRLTRVFKALANERRLIIIKSLRSDSKVVSYLSDDLGISIRCVSKHLQKLERENLITRKKKGKYVIYQVARGIEKSGLMKQIRES